MTVRTNADRLVTQILAGEVWPPLADRHGYRVDADGRPFILPGMGGVTLGVHAGDPATGYASDHLEPGLSVRHAQAGPNMALQFLSCVGNLVTVRSGPAAGATGRVLGQHAYVLVDMPDESMREVSTGDQVLVVREGTGAHLLDHPEIVAKNLDPAIGRPAADADAAGRQAPDRRRGQGPGRRCRRGSRNDLGVREHRSDGRLRGSG